MKVRRQQQRRKQRVHTSSLCMLLRIKEQPAAKKHNRLREAIQVGLPAWKKAKAGFLGRNCGVLGVWNWVDGDTDDDAGSSPFQGLVEAVAYM